MDKDASSGTTTHKLLFQSKTNQEIISRLPWLALDCLAGFSENALQIPSPDCSADVDYIRREIVKFHKRAGTLTDELLCNAEAYSGTNVVRLAHQPNYFGYEKLIGQFEKLNVMCKAISGSVPVFYSIDYDVVSNPRFRRADYPLVGEFGGPELGRFQLPKSAYRQRTLLAHASPTPNQQQLSQMMAGIKRCAKALVDVGLNDVEVTRNTEVLIDDVMYSSRNSTSLSDFCQVLLSRIVNLRLGLSVLFLPGTIMWRESGHRVLEYYLENESEIVKSILMSADFLDSEFPGLGQFSRNTDPPFWLMCECGSRMPIKQAAKTLSYSTFCPHCHDLRSHGRGSLYEMKQTNRLFPKILAHNLGNRKAFGYMAGTSHIGSIEHILHHSLVLDRIGIMPLAQQVSNASGSFSNAVLRVFDRNGIILTDTQKNVLESGNTSFAFIYLVVGEPIRSERNNAVL